MLAAFESLTRFNPTRGSFSTWLFTIACRRVSDWERRERRRWKLFDREQRLRTDESGRDDVLDAVVRHDEIEQARAAISRLRPGDREVVLLRYSAGLSSEEFSHVLGISRAAARTRLSRALDRIARDLERAS